MEPFYPETKPQKNLVNRFFSYLEALPYSDSFFLKIALFALIGCLLWFGITLSTQSQVDVASDGGSFIEGVVGTPRFVNPVLAVTRADKDLTALIYDGLMVLGPEGKLIPNLAESVTVSEDGLTYNVILRKDIHFQDGTPLTSLDVVFTLGRIQELSLASPLRANFDGVTVEQVGDYELNFILKAAYTPFIENLTFGILPQHVWKDASNEEFPFSQRNSEPIGAGPYMISKILRNASGIPESYILKPYPEYHNGKPKIDTLILKFFANEDKLIEAFQTGKINSLAGIDQSRLYDLHINSETHTVVTIPLPRTFALFINQNKSPALRDRAARQALNIAIDRAALVDTVLGGYGIPLSTPLPQGFGIPPALTSSTTEATGVDAARAILRDAGWKLNTEAGVWEKNIDGTLTPLTFSIATINNSIFESTAEFLRTTWETLGASVTVKQFEQTDLTQAIIRPRDYETLLFGTQVGRSLDFYSFWHSSQRNDPGLNVALYANITTDSILSEARTDANSADRDTALLRFSEEIAKEIPAIFLYEPELLYVFPNTVSGASFTGIGEPSERFSNISDWYINTESVWSFFKNNISQ